MKKIKVTVIIPVYNSEKYLERCLDSVVNQTIKDIEIIVVNDGSTDNSKQIVEFYAKIHKNIITITQSNSGQGIARNRAIDKARGEYLAFVDSDDYIEPDMLETLYNEVINDDLDMIIFNWNYVNQSGDVLDVKDHSSYNNQIFDQVLLVHEFLTNRQALIEGFSWNKFIDRKLFEREKIRYPNMKFEDIPTVFHVITRTKRSKYINKVMYHYVKNDTSTVHSMSEKNIPDFINSIEMVGTILKKENILHQFEADYFAYKGNLLLREYCRSFEVIKSSVESSTRFKKVLSDITVRRCFATGNFTDLKLLMKIIFYRVGVLHWFTRIFHKIKPVY